MRAATCSPEVAQSTPPPTIWRPLKAAEAMPVDEAQFRHEMAVMAAQRNTKIVGVFARLYKRDGKARYLAYHAARLAPPWNAIWRIRRWLICGPGMIGVIPKGQTRGGHNVSKITAAMIMGRGTWRPHAPPDRRSAQAAGECGRQDADRSRHRPPGGSRA